MNWETFFQFVIAGLCGAFSGVAIWYTLKFQAEARERARRKAAAPTVYLHLGTPREGVHDVFDPRPTQMGLEERRTRWIAHLDRIQAEQQALQDAIDEITQ